MSLQDTIWAQPSACYRLKSCYDTWLGLDISGNAAFWKEQDRSIVIFLLPCEDGRYMLQLLSDSLIRLQESSNLAMWSLTGWHQADGSEDVTDSGCWFFCKQGQLMSISPYAQECHEDFLFSLAFDDYGCVALSCGLFEKQYWMLDSSRKLLFGAQNIGKMETFQLCEYDYSSVARKVSMAPVRIYLKAHTGKYLCCASAVIGAGAEAPCCCEEFLLDVNFPPSVPYWGLFNGTTAGCEVQPMAKVLHCFNPSDPRVRTGNGMLNWSVGADGKLVNVQLDEAQGHEHFTVEIFPHKRHSIVGISHHCSEASSNHLCYVSAEPSGRVTCNKLQKGKWEEFALELVNESRILIQTVHGFFLGGQEASMFVNASSHPKYHKKGGIYEFSPNSNIVAWKLRAHGDLRYTLVAATRPSDRGDFYLHVDGKGKVMQSNEPAVHFPSLASLFEIKPVSRACFASANQGIGQQMNAENSLIGFTIKTVRKVNGKQRYLSAEPNGNLRVNSVRVSRWEIFRLLDVDATASAISPHEFSCVPAAVNFPHAGMLMSLPNPYQNAAAVVQCTDFPSLHPGSIRQQLRRNNHLSGKPIRSVASMKKASQVAALAAWMGQCLPTRMPASLQELCVNQLCLQVSAEAMKSEDKLHPIAWGTEFLVESCLGVPDDLCTKIVASWRSRQHPKSACKSSLSISPVSYNNRIDHDVQVPSNIAEHSLWEGNDEGFYCHSCNQKGVLIMSPIVNPAHHRYLEVQYHVQNGNGRPSGFLWNLISLTGVSIMSTALLCHFFTGSRKKQRSSKPVQ